MNKYYIEFCVKNSGDAYSIQSRIFESKKEAINWVKLNIDYIDVDTISVYVMRMECYEDGSYDIFDEEKLFK